MFEQFQVVVVGGSKGCSTAVLLLSVHLTSLCSLQLLPQHPPHCAVLLHAVLQAQYSCKDDYYLPHMCVNCHKCISC